MKANSDRRLHIVKTFAAAVFAAVFAAAAAAAAAPFFRGVNVGQQERWTVGRC